MAGTPGNVRIIKPQGIYYAAVGTALPTVAGTLGGTVDFSAWMDPGYIDPDGKIKVKFSSKQIDVRAMGLEGDLMGFKVQKKAVIEFMGFEKTLENLAVAIGGTVAGSELPDGGDGQVPYYAWAFVEDGLVYHFKKLGAMDDTDDEIADDEVSKVKFALKTFVEEAATAGQRQWNILKRT